MKSPIKDKPLRNPGQSLGSQIEEYKYDHILTYLFAALIAVLLMLLEWWRWYRQIPPSPWVYTFVAAAVSSFSVWKIAKAIPGLSMLKQGRDGERAVGQYLERLRENGAKVFHDVIGDGFNLDHVVIAKSGIYVIETKTYSKPDRGEAIITYNGEEVYLNGRPSKSNLIVQVKAAASWLREQLKESTGKDFKYRPVVVFPGWYIEPTADAKASDVWVLNPKALPTFISNSKEQLNDEDVALSAYHLSRYVRTVENK